MRKLFRDLRIAIDDRELTHGEFAAKLGLCTSALSARFNGRREWQLGEMYKALDLLKLPHGELPVYFPPEGKRVERR